MNEKLKTEFAQKYVRFAGFIDSGFLWDQCVKALDNQELMEHIRFCNDVMRIPPIKVFILAMHLEKNEELAHSREARQAIGAVFAFVFKDLWGYKNPIRVSCRINGIQTASIYEKE